MTDEAKDDYSDEVTDETLQAIKEHVASEMPEYIPVNLSDVDVMHQLARVFTEAREALARADNRPDPSLTHGGPDLIEISRVLRLITQNHGLLLVQINPDYQKETP